MTAFLTIIVLLLVFIAIWQMTKIFELSQVASQNSQVANDKDNHLNGQLMFACLIFIYLITIFSFWQWGDILLGKSASEHGPEYDSLMEVSMILIFFVQIVTQA
jgi:cytochrome c oxidase subunit 2